MSSKKNYYKTKIADRTYNELLVFNITLKELKGMDEVISPLILKGQSISHIFTHFKLAQILLDTSLLDNLLLEHIYADEVHLKPTLFLNKMSKI